MTTSMRVFGPTLLSRRIRPLGRRPRRQTPRFEHEDALAGEPGLVEQGQRHAGGLAGARRGFQNGLVLCAKGLAQGGNNGVDG